MEGGAFVAAKDASPETADHPLVGSWVLDTDTEDPENPLSLARFSADGGYIEIDADGSGLGSWEATGETTATLTFSFVDEGGVGTVRASLEVAPDGQSLTATYTLEFGEGTGEYGPGSAEGTRMSVEEPGTPAGTLEDLFGQFEEPEATPES